MKKVAFYLENQNISDVDLTHPEFGNPGCGGTEFLFVALPYYMEQATTKLFSPVLLANHIDRLPSNIECLKVSNVLDAARVAKELGCLIFIYRPRRHTEVELLELIDQLEINSIAWAHITPLPKHLRAIAKTQYVKALVCVEREQHDLAMDSAVIDKLTCIVNGFDVENFQLKNPPTRENNLVVYLGALVPQKGFHILAKIWPKILQRCPDAKLLVIGTGALYDKNSQMGKLGIAEENYENEFIVKYLTNNDGNLHQSVKFLGKLGIEKKEILYRALVGISNPSGQTENCPGSALEFQACGTAVVSGAYYGLLDTVLHGKTGLLGTTEDDLIRNICFCLENPDIAKKLGMSGVDFVKKRYNYEKVVFEWIDLFEAILKNKRPKKIPFKWNLLKHHKIFIVLNSVFQTIFGRGLNWPSIIEIKYFISKIKGRLI